MQSRRLEILKKVEDKESFPSLSPLANKLLEMAADNSCTARDISDLISQDPGLTTRLLKITNSSAFRTRKTISTLSQAVVLLGFNRVRGLVLGLSLRDTFPLGRKGGMDYDRFWRISLYRGLIAQGLAQAVNYHQPEEAFVAGLILEIGQLMVYQVLEAELQNSYPKVWLTTPEFIAWEQEHLGIHHREVGKIILTRWGFPNQLVEVQTYWGIEALGEDTPILATLIELARLGAEALFVQGDELYLLHKNAFTRFKLAPPIVDGLLTESLSQVDAIADALKIEGNRDKDLLSVMEKANKALQRLNAQLENQVQSFLNRIEYKDANFAAEGEERLVRAREQAIESALQAVAHEIRNPLMSLSGFARRLSKTLSEENAYLGIILAEASRLDGVLKEMSTFSRSYRPEFRLINLCSLMEDVLAEVAEAMAARKVELIKQYDYQGVQEMYLDEASIKQVFNQCILNALSRAEADNTRLVVILQSHPSRKEISITFEDSGKPMTPDLLSMLSDPIFTSKTFGVGLGLPMARKIVNRHGGRIEVKRGAYGGNRVEIVLPLEIASMRPQ
jgi:HD-like signal output (HDOD) protein/signal transduction histidine kinase